MGWLRVRCPVDSDRVGRLLFGGNVRTHTAKAIPTASAVPAATSPRRSGAVLNVQRRPAMNDERLIDALRTRAADDARRFRKEFPGDAPNEKWIDNCYSAALPLAARDAGVTASSPDPALFDLYARTVAEVLGITFVREDSERDRKKNDDIELQEPTPGEG